MKQVQSDDNPVAGILVFCGAIAGLALILALSPQAFMAILAIIVFAALVKVVSWLDRLGVFDGPELATCIALVAIIAAVLYYGIKLHYGIQTGIWL